MERVINLVFAIVLALITIAALYGGLFAGAEHQLRVALLTGTLSYLMFNEAKRHKTN